MFGAVLSKSLQSYDTISVLVPKHALQFASEKIQCTEIAFI